jgi:hypothetical protein
MDTQTLVKALEEFQDHWERRAIPSPSTIGQCIRKQWFLALGTAPSERIDPAGILSFERGKAMQSLAYTLLEAVGAKVSPRILLPLEALKHLSCTRLQDEGEIDGLARDEDGMWLVEIKWLNAWGYLSFVEHGLRPDDPFDKIYIDQVQSYLLALSSIEWGTFSLKGAIYIVFAADPSAANWIATKIKKWPNAPPPLTVALFELNGDTAGAAVARARQVAWLRDNTIDATQVARDFDPFKPDKPCKYCGFWTLCKGAL